MDSRMEARLRQVLEELGIGLDAPIVPLCWGEALPKVADALARRGYAPQEVDARLALVAVGAFVDGQVSQRKEAAR